jgi:hypothetical protein
VRVASVDGSEQNVVVGAVAPDGTPHTVGAELPPDARRIDAILFDPESGALLAGGFQARISRLDLDGHPAAAFREGLWQATLPPNSTCRSIPNSTSLNGAPADLTLGFSGASFYDCPPVGITAAVTDRLPVVVSADLARSQGWHAGSDVQLQVAGAGGNELFNAHVGAVVNRFATIGPSDQLQLVNGNPSGFVLAPLAGLTQRWAAVPAWPSQNADQGRPLPTEAWASWRGLPAASRPPTGSDGLLVRASTASDIAHAPLQEALLGATVAGVSLALAVALAGLAAQLALSARRRRIQLGVLRSIGLDRLRLLGMLGTEYLLLAALALMVAIPAGIVLLRILLPFIDLNGDGSAVIPPTQLVVPVGALTELALAILIATAIAVTIALVVSVQARLHDVLRLGDD